MKRVLFIEDDPDHAALIIDELDSGDTNIEIMLKKNGQDAIDYLQELYIDDNAGMQFQIDLIISDLNLPKVHGMDILRFLKDDSRYRSIPVIIISTSTDSSAISGAYENGAADYIIKPSSFKEFTVNVRLMKQKWLVQNL